MLSHMPRTRSQRTPHALKTGFRPGRSGPGWNGRIENGESPRRHNGRIACEARLYQFTGVANGEGQPPVKRVAASDLHEAITYMRKWHSDLDILRVELVALIEMVSGSPLN